MRVCVSTADKPDGLCLGMPRDHVMSLGSRSFVSSSFVLSRSVVVAKCDNLFVFLLVALSHFVR